MRVLTTANFCAQHAGGVIRYFANLLQRFPNDWSPVLRSNACKKTLGTLHPQLKVDALPFMGMRPQSLMQCVDRRQAELRDLSADYDSLHPIYYSRLPERFVRNGRHPIVATVFDLTWNAF